jgi:hypothetical protein
MMGWGRCLGFSFARVLTWFGDGNHFYLELKVWSFIIDDARLTFFRYLKGRRTHFGDLI